MGKKLQRGASAEQLSFELFDQPPTRQESIKHIAWSYSKRSLFEQCQRRYYYEYFGTASALASVEPQYAQLRQLKALEGRHERAGSLLHKRIARYLRLAQAGTLMPVEEFTDWLLHLFQRDCEYSRSDPDGTHPPPGPYPPVLLMEYHYRQPDADQLMEACAQQLREAAHGFLAEPLFAPFREAGTRPDALIEKHLSLPELPCKIGGVLDLAFVEDGKVTIVDWKSGSADGSGTESLQLAVYALWAQDHYQVAPEAIHIYKAFLREAAVETFVVTAQLLEQARIRIIQDAERMAVAHPYGEAGRADAFSTCGQVRVCRLCPYQRVCPEGSQQLNA